MLNWMLNRYHAPNRSASCSVRPRPPLCSSGCAAAAATTAGRGGWRAAVGRAAAAVRRRPLQPGGDRIAAARNFSRTQTWPRAPGCCCGAAWATVRGLLRLGLPAPAGRGSVALRCRVCCDRDGSLAAGAAAGLACELPGQRSSAAGRWQASIDAMVASAIWGRRGASYKYHACAPAGIILSSTPATGRPPCARQP